MAAYYQIFPVGFIRKKRGLATIEIDRPYTEALLGLEQFSHIYVIYWLHKNDTPEKRRTLQVHPKGKKRNPLTGVFATHSPYRPNLLALTVCRIQAIRGRVIVIDGIDAVDGTPVIDIKSYNPKNEAVRPTRVPGWARARNESCS